MHLFKTNYRVKRRLPVQGMVMCVLGGVGSDGEVRGGGRSQRIQVSMLFVCGVWKNRGV